MVPCIKTGDLSDTDVVPRLGQIWRFQTALATAGVQTF